MGCCDNKHVIQASEEAIRENVREYKLSSYLYTDMEKLINSNIVYGKIQKSKIESTILSKTNKSFQYISPLEESFFSSIISCYSNSLSQSECLFYMYIFLKKPTYDPYENNKFLFEILKGMVVSKLTLNSLEKLLIEYFYIATTKLNNFFEENLKDREFKEELKLMSKSLFNNDKITLVTKTLLEKMITIDPTISNKSIIEFDTFNKCFSNTDLSNLTEVRDLFFAMSE